MEGESADLGLPQPTWQNQATRAASPNLARNANGVRQATTTLISSSASKPQQSFLSLATVGSLLRKIRPHHELRFAFRSVIFRKPSAVRRAYNDMERRLYVSHRHDIEALLLRGLAPITDNAAVLIELGFARVNPDARTGFESTVWELALDHGYRQTGSEFRREVVRQRAFLMAEKKR